VSPEDESRWACPACGAHRLALEELPKVGAMGAQPYTDILGMGDPTERRMPAIVCLACGRRWGDANAFWAEADPSRVEPAAESGTPGSSEPDEPRS
jgi:hypothetical protein